MSLGLGDQAYVNYQQGLAKGEMTAIPRNKFSFTVSLNTIDGSVDLTRIANVQMPSFVMRTQTINRYNHKHVVQTGVDYTPITLTAYDNKDAEFEKFLKDYARHYVAGPMNDDDYASWLESPKGIEIPADGHYIRSMLIKRIDTKTLSNEIEIFHPFISNADADTLDYSDSSPTTFRVSFQYEGYRILSDTTPPEPVPVVAGASLEELNHVEEFSDTSGTYETTAKKFEETGKEIQLESNKAELIEYPTYQVLEDAQLIRAQGITSTDARVRDAEMAAIAIDANKVENNDAKFVLGENKIVTLDGQQYMVSKENNPELFTKDSGYDGDSAFDF